MKNSEQIKVPDGLTYEDIRLMYHTGVFIRDYGSQDKKAGRYRIGVMTKIGDIEVSEWIQYAEELIRRNNDEDMFGKLKRWFRESCAWFRDEKELHRYTLECFVAGLPDNPEWVDYVEFNKLHRPELLSSATQE